VTKDEQLHGLRRIRPRQPRQPSKHLDHHQIQHPHHHHEIMAGLAKRQLTDRAMRFGTVHDPAGDPE
jgi:hypothetical protein